MAKQYNVNIVGNLTNNDGVISGFSSNDYMTITNTAYVPQGGNWELVMCVTTGNTISDSNIYAPNPWEHGVYIGLNNGYFSYLVGDVGNGWLNPSQGYIATSYSVLTNTTYYLKVTCDINNSGYYFFHYSLDGQNWVQLLQCSSTNQVAVNPHDIGVGFSGSIDLNKCYLKIDDTTVWQGITNSSVQYNVVTYGNLTNTNGVLSGFSGSSYATIPLNFNPVQRPFEVVFKFAGTNGVVWDVGDVTTPRGHVEFEIYQSKLYSEFAANSILIWSIEGVTTLSSNTNYWVKLTYNGVDTYGLYLSTDGTTWNTEGTATSSNFLSDGSTQYNLIGCQTDNGAITYSFDGSIDLNESYINIDNIRWWQGATVISNVRTRIQLRHDTAANWTSVNPVLLDGEVGIETDTLKQKVGDGTTAWNSLPYQIQDFISNIPVGLNLSIDSGILSAQPGHVTSQTDILKTSSVITTEDISTVSSGVTNGVILGETLQYQSVDLTSGVTYIYADAGGTSLNTMTENSKGAWLIASSSQGTNSSSWAHYGLVFDTPLPAGQYKFSVSTGASYGFLYACSGEIGNFTIISTIVNNEQNPQDVEVNIGSPIDALVWVVGNYNGWSAPYGLEVQEYESAKVFKTYLCKDNNSYFLKLVTDTSALSSFDDYAQIGQVEYDSALLNPVATPSEDLKNTFVNAQLSTKDWIEQQGFLTGITNSDVVAALGYTPYNSSNPNGYTSNVGTVTSVNNTQPDANGNVSLSISTSLSGLTDVSLSSPTQGQNLTYDATTGKWKNTSTSATVAWGGITGTLSDQTDLQNALDAKTTMAAVEAKGYITGITSSDVTTALGYTPYNSSNPDGYITGITSSDVTTALGYTPYNSTNPDGYITGITSSMVTTALGFTPYNSTNPDGYITGITSSDVTTALGFTPANASDLSNYVTTSTDQDITGTKTFVGSKKVAFKQSGNSDKLGFTLFTNNNVEKGYLEFNPTNTIDGAPLMTLGNYATSTSGITQVGFRRYSSVSGANGAYNLLTPLIADAKTPFNLTTTYTNFYLPLGFTDGTATVLAAKSGVVDLSSLLSGFLKGITSSDVTTALGYTPYNSTNPDGYITGITSSDVTTALGYTPVNPSSLATVATTGAYSDLTGTPTVDQTYDGTSTNAQSGVAIDGAFSDYLQDYALTSNLSTVAFTGDYSDLTGIPSEMIGATSSTDGTSGLVPAPLAGDEDKFLKGDGTWAASSGGLQYAMVVTDYTL